MAALAFALLLKAVVFAAPIEVKPAGSTPGVSLSVRGNWTLSRTVPHGVTYTVGNSQMLTVVVESDRDIKDAKQYQQIMLPRVKKIESPGQSSGPILLGLNPGVIRREKMGFELHTATRHTACSVQYADIAHPLDSDYRQILQDVCDHFHWTK